MSNQPERSRSRKAFTKKLPIDNFEYFEILGKADAVSLRSGYVTLLPGKDVGWHSTENYEELLVILEGCGKVQIKGNDDLEIAAGQIAYNPPWTEHNVVNIGPEPLRYIYIVAPTT